MNFKVFVPFGYEGDTADVCVKIEKGDNAFDIKGLFKDDVESTKECVRSAIENSGYTFPEGKVTVTLNAENLLHSADMCSFAIALAILAESKPDAVVIGTDNVTVGVVGELLPSGKVCTVRGAYAAARTLLGAGVRTAFFPMDTEALPDHIHIERVESLNEAFVRLCDEDNIYITETYTKTACCISNGFTVEEDAKISFKPVTNDDENPMGLVGRDLLYALAVAAAGRHSIMIMGNANDRMRNNAIKCMSYLLPNLYKTEQDSVNRIYSIAGLMKPDRKIIHRPFQAPSSTAGIEAIFGGGKECNPGTISLAHKGVLFLDDASEFKTSVLQMLGVPLSTGNITISRAGRQTVFPANFKLAMTVSPCPCGHSGAECLCSETAIRQHQDKVCKPLLKNIEIAFNMDFPPAAHREFENLSDLHKRIQTAVKRQLDRQGVFNGELTDTGVEATCVSTGEASRYLGAYMGERNIPAKYRNTILCLARTILDLQEGNYNYIGSSSMIKACNMFSGFPRSHYM